MIDERNMVERVARAMARKDYPNWHSEMSEADFVDGVWSDFIGLSKAAIDAMREPTSAMLAQAGAVEVGPDGRDSDLAHIAWWQDMIDSALWSGDTVQ